MKRWHLGYLLLVLALALCVSCSNLKNTVVTDQNKAKLLARIGNGNEVTDEERHLLVEYSLRYSMAAIMKGGRPDLPTGKTLGQMIQEQRAWDAEQARAQAAQGNAAPPQSPSAGQNQSGH